MFIIFIITTILLLFSVVRLKEESNKQVYLEEISKINQLEFGMLEQQAMRSILRGIYMLFIVYYLIIALIFQNTIITFLSTVEIIFTIYNLYIGYKTLKNINILSNRYVYCLINNLLDCIYYVVIIIFSLRGIF